MEDLIKRTSVLEAKVEIIIKAFPHVDDSADFEGHRKAHEAMIKAAEAQARFWDELKLEVAKKGVVGLLVLIIGLIAAGLVVKVGVLGLAFK